MSTQGNAFLNQPMGIFFPMQMATGPPPRREASTLSSASKKLATVGCLSKLRNSRVARWFTADRAFFCFTKSHMIRSWAQRLVEWRWFERICLAVIAINCITMAMASPCQLNIECTTLQYKCTLLEIVDHVVSAFFLFEMLVKMLAHCAVGHRTAYLANSWNRLDFVIVLASILEYGFASDTSSNWTLIRIIRILRPIRAVKRIPSLRLLVTLLCDTLPALSSVMALIVFIYFIFGIIGVQLWSGVLRQRCFLNEIATSLIANKGQQSNHSIELFRYASAGSRLNEENLQDTHDHLSQQLQLQIGNITSYLSAWEIKQMEKTIMPLFYKSIKMPDFLCGGVQQCGDIASFETHHSMCESTFDGDSFHHDLTVNDQAFCKHMIASNSYNQCKPSSFNPLNGGISFDNILIAFITIFQAVSPEGWTDVMYLVQDAYSFWAWPYFVLLVVIVTFGISNLSFIIVAVQIPQTKKRLAQKMKQEAEEANKGLNSWFSTVAGQQLTAVNLADQTLVQKIKTAEAPLKPSGPDVHGNFYSQLVDAAVEHIRERVLIWRRKRKYARGEIYDGSSGWSEEISCQPACCKNHCQIFSKSRIVLRRVLSHHIATVFIAAAIIINTALLAAEHHNQPQHLTSVCEWMNMVFTILFTIEIILKLYAFGIVGFIRDGFNMLDLIIVFINLVDLTQSSGSHLSVLRTFRLLRIVKLLRFLPVMQQQLTALFHTVNNVAPFLVLFSLFLFIFCVLGMSLFGCKYCDDLIGKMYNSIAISNASTGANLSKPAFANRQFCQGNGISLERHNNFESLLTSLLSVLKILTQDDGWAEVLRDTMHITSSTWTAVYFVCLVMFGNYVILSMLLAIIDVGASPAAARMRQQESTNLRFSTTRSTSQIRADVEEQLSFRSPRTQANSSRRSSVKPSKDFSPVSQPLTENYRHHFKKRQPPHSGKNAFGPVMRKIMSAHRLSSSFEKLQDSGNVQWLDSQGSLTSTGNEPSNSCLLSPATTTSMASFAMRDYICQLQASNSELSNAQQGVFSPSATMESFQLLTVNEEKIPLTMSTSSMAIRNNLFQLQESASRCSVSPGQKDSEEIGAADPCAINTPETLKNEKPPHASISMTSIAIRSYITRLQSQPSITTSRERLENFDGHPKEDDEANDGDQGEETLPLNRKLSMTTTNENDSRCSYSLFLFSKQNGIRKFLIWLINSRHYDTAIIVIVALSCVTVTLERPVIKSESLERLILNSANQFFSAIFFGEAVLKIVALGFVIGKGTYLRSGWNILDFVLVVFSLLDFITELGAFQAGATTVAAKAFRGLRLLRTFRPLRAINRTPGLKQVTGMLGNSVKSMANVIFICSIFYGAFAVLGLQMLRGCFYRCVISDASDGIEESDSLMSNYSSVNQTNFKDSISSSFFPHEELFSKLDKVRTRNDCLAVEGLAWENPEHTFDNFLESLRALLVVVTFDGWIEIAQNGVNCVGIDQQPIENYNPWRLIYFLSYLVLIGFCMVEMFMGVICSNYRHMRSQPNKADSNASPMAMAAGKALDAVAPRLGRRRGGIDVLPSGETGLAFWLNYPKWRRQLFHLCNHVYFDIVIAVLIAANVIEMSAEHYMMPRLLSLAFRYSNYFFTGVFTLEFLAKLVSFGPRRYCRDRWNQLDIAVCLLSIGGILLEEIGTTRLIPVINPKIIRIIRVIRVVRALKLLKVARGVQQLLDTVRQVLPQVGNLSLLFLLLFFIYASLGVELLGRLECEYNRCEGLSRHANFHNFGMALLTLFRISTGDKWGEIMQDVLELARSPGTSCFGIEYAALNDTVTDISGVEEKQDLEASTTVSTYASDKGERTGGNDCAIVTALAPIYFTSFYLLTQFFLVNVIVAALMHHLEESERQGIQGQAEDTQPATAISKDQSVTCSPSLQEVAINRSRTVSELSEMNETDVPSVFERSSLIRPSQKVDYGTVYRATASDIIK